LKKEFFKNNKKKGFCVSNNPEIKSMQILTQIMFLFLEANVYLCTKDAKWGVF